MKGGNKAEQKAEIPELKIKFLEYYSKLPNQKLAAGYIGRGEDCITLWKKEDKEFSASILKLRSEWAAQKVGKVRSQEWLLERIMKDDFAQRSEYTGKDGESLIPKPLLGGSTNVSSNSSHQEDTSTK